jgi:hypothetical protein
VPAPWASTAWMLSSGQLQGCKGFDRDATSTWSLPGRDAGGVLRNADRHHHGVRVRLGPKAEEGEEARRERALESV